VLEIVLTNANNGQSGYHIDAGVFKLACLNGLVVKSKDWGGVSIRHTGDPRMMVVEGTYQVIANAKKAMDAPAKWSKMLLSDARRLLFAQEAHKLRFGDDHRITPEQLLIHRRPADEGRDLWSIFNVVQENCVTGGLVGTRGDGKRRQRHAQPKTQLRRERHRQVHAQHEQRPVREIDDARHAEDQRQSGGDQEQRRGARQAVEELDQDRGGGHANKKGGLTPFFCLRAVL